MGHMRLGMGIPMGRLGFLDNCLLIRMDMEIICLIDPKRPRVCMVQLRLLRIRRIRLGRTTLEGGTEGQLSGVLGGGEKARALGSAMAMDRHMCIPIPIQRTPQRQRPWTQLLHPSNLFLLRTRRISGPKLKIIPVLNLNEGNRDRNLNPNRQLALNLKRPMYLEPPRPLSIPDHPAEQLSIKVLNSPKLPLLLLLDPTKRRISNQSRRRDLQLKRMISLIDSREDWARNLFSNAQYVIIQSHPLNKFGLVYPPIHLLLHLSQSGSM